MGLENLLLGFEVAITPFNLVVAVIGITLGTIIGVLPGLGGANGVAILLPLTFAMPPTSAIILLTSIYWGALFGGAITSVLFNIPGEPWSVATTFDGYPLARQGQGGQALTAAFTSSFVGAFFSIVLITFFAPLLAEVALKFGPPEFFAIQLLTFSSFVGLGGGSPVKSFVSIMLGFILGAIGLDVVTGRLRLTFGSAAWAVIDLLRVKTWFRMPEVYGATWGISGIWPATKTRPMSPEPASAKALPSASAGSSACRSPTSSTSRPAASPGRRWPKGRRAGF